MNTVLKASRVQFFKKRQNRWKIIRWKFLMRCFFSRPPSHVSLCGNKIQEMCDNEQNVAERMKILKGETLFTRAKSTSIRIEFYGQFKFFPASKIFHAWLDNDSSLNDSLCSHNEKGKNIYLCIVWRAENLCAFASDTFVREILDEDYYYGTRRVEIWMWKFIYDYAI